jgi:hypothetical protein
MCLPLFIANMMPKGDEQTNGSNRLIFDRITILDLSMEHEKTSPIVDDF